MTPFQSLGYVAGGRQGYSPTIGVMKVHIEKHLLGIAIGILATISGQRIAYKCPTALGIVKAHFDLLRGKYYIKATCGLALKRDEFNEVYNRHGIEVINVGGCDVSWDVVEEGRGYNYVSLQAIDDKYGEHFFDSLLPSPKFELEEMRPK